MSSASLHSVSPDDDEDFYLCTIELVVDLIKNLSVIFVKLNYKLQFQCVLLYLRLFYFLNSATQFLTGEWFLNK